MPAVCQRRCRFACKIDSCGTIVGPLHWLSLICSHVAHRTAASAVKLRVGDAAYSRRLVTFAPGAATLPRQISALVSANSWFSTLLS